ncbi:BRCT domain-containing protein [Fimicolochytrium jonesii]|uniref:BRCT domain-containing protein n=1 Tax=Fimicolochytrium jonesii TaxID=1396493 RepID=UPI0022FE8900|nr:BRCT domain-containing protein [Fimicolochytrium jonesii]KAI8825940.1 BRCT domain-containing protein [Fimicolochytrium jonesii]
MDKFVVRTKRLNATTPPGTPPNKKPALSTADLLKPSAANRATFKTQHYTNPARGHQDGSGGDREKARSYMAARKAKLHAQGPEAVSGMFKGCCFYVNGYQNGVSDLDLRALIQRHGGTLSITLGMRTVTHMVCTALAGGKTQKLLAGRKPTTLRIVRPEWVLDSVKEGRRLPERGYGVIGAEDVFLAGPCLGSLT